MNAPIAGEALHKQVVELLGQHLGQVIAEVIVEKACEAAQIKVHECSPQTLHRHLGAFEKRVNMFARDAATRARCVGALRDYAARLQGGTDDQPALHIDIGSERDVSLARQQVWQFCSRLGFGLTDQTKVATVASELTRNIVMYVGRGVLAVDENKRPRRGIRLVASDNGPGIVELDQILDGDYRSRRGMGLGLRGSKNIMDVFEIDSRPGTGTRITAIKYCP